MDNPSTCSCYGMACATIADAIKQHDIAPLNGCRCLICLTLTAAGKDARCTCPQCREMRRVLGKEQTQIFAKYETYEATLHIMELGLSRPPRAEEIQRGRELFASCWDELCAVMARLLGHDTKTFNNAQALFEQAQAERIRKGAVAKGHVNN